MPPSSSNQQRIARPAVRSRLLGWWIGASLRSKALLLVALTLIALLVALAVPMRLVLLQSYAAFEERALRNDARRALGALAERADVLANSVADYATWDDSYAFMGGERPTYPDESMRPEALAAIDVSFEAFLDLHGRVVQSVAIDIQTGSAQPIVPALAPGAQADARWLVAVAADAGTHGVLVLNDTPFLVAAGPVLRSDGSGPKRGTLLMGRALDAAQVEIFAKNLFPFSVHRLADAAASPEVAAALVGLQRGEETIVAPRNADAIAAYTLQRDLVGAPALVVQLNQARPIMRQGVQSVTFFSIALASVGLVFGALLLLLIERLVLTRIVRLSAAVQTIGKGRDLTARVAGFELHDEVGRLAAAVNAMMAELEQSQRDREEAEAARAQAQEALARSKEHLFQMIIHDLKNPLTGLIGYIDLMRLLPPGSAQEELVAGARRSGATLMGLVNDVLDLARFEEGRLDVRMQECDLVVLLRSCHDEVGVWVAHEHKELTLDTPFDAKPVLLDPSLMRRVVVNLLSNAIKHTPRSTPIELGCRADADGWRIWVHDAGPGIPAERQHSIFERFNATGATPASQSSTGLGLAFCALAVKAHGATLHLESSPEHGTTFTICAPAHPDLTNATADLVAAVA